MKIFQTINDKNYGKNWYLDNFVFPSPSPSEQCWGTMIKTCVKQCYQFAVLYRGRGGILNTLFKIPIIFCQWLWVVPRLTQYFILLRLIKWASETPGNWMGKSKLSPRSGWVTPLIKRSHDVFFFLKKEPPWVLFTFLKLYKLYQITERISSLPWLDWTYWKITTSIPLSAVKDYIIYFHSNFFNKKRLVAKFEVVLSFLTQAGCLIQTG